MNKKLNGVIIGLGKIAVTSHLEAYNTPKLKKIINIIGGVDISKERREEVEKKMPGIKCYRTIEECLKDFKPDFIDICVPPSLHSHYIDIAVKEGIHILCEKPFTVNFNQALKIKEKLKNKKIVFYFCHQYKYSEIWKNFKKFVDTKKPNSKVFLQFNIYRTKVDSGYDKANPDWRINKDLSGGGIFADTGVHYLYLSLWMLGFPLEITTINDNLKYLKNNVEDTSIIIMKSKSGIVEINLTWAADSRANFAYATDGERCIQYNGENVTIMGNDVVKKIKVPNATDKTTYIKQYENLILDFANSISEDVYSKEMLLEGFNSIKILNLGYKSAKTGKTVKISGK